MSQQAFAYPKLYYFQSGNPYTGSYRGMNYKLEPTEIEDEDGEKSKILFLTVWYGMFCSDVSEPEAEFFFSFDEEGLEKSRAVLWEQYIAYQKKSLSEEN